MTDVKSFFDAHGHDHNYYRAPDFYNQVAAVLKNMKSPIRMLDLGCGDGSFIKTIIQYGIRGDYLGIDLSNSMLHTASRNLRPYDVKLILGDGFSLPLKQEIKFDIIHLDSVLHHLVGKTRVRAGILFTIYSLFFPSLLCAQVN
jgi:ubiquinone/menaquinone biosynthesis C-methylase UbiE